MALGASGLFHREEGDEGAPLPLYQAVRAEAGLAEAGMLEMRAPR